MAAPVSIVNTNQDLKVTRINSDTRQLDVRFNLLGAVTANEMYVRLFGEPDYTTAFKDNFPYAPKFAGTVATNVFTGTSIPIDLAGKYAVAYKSSEVTTKNTKADFSTIASLNYDVRKITGSTATTITVTGNFTTGMTDVIVLDNIWFKIPQITDFTFSETADDVSVDDRDSGGFKMNITGMKDANITGINGNSYPYLPILVQLKHAQSVLTPVEARTYSSVEKYEIVTKLMVKVKSFAQLGTPTKADKLQYNIEFANAGAPIKETIITAGTIPDFMS